MKGHWITWHPEELAWIEARKDWPRADLHRAFCAFWQRYDVSLVALIALCKRKRWLTGRNGCWVKGQVSRNKGQKMPPEVREKVAATMFRKGARPKSWRGAGHEAIDKRQGYVWMIVDETNPYTGAPTRRVQKHKWLWEKAHGPVPAGHALKCLDGNKLNTDPSNWAAVPRSMMPRLAGRQGRVPHYDTAPAELKPTLMAIAQLEQAARDARNRTTA